MTTTRATLTAVDARPFSAIGGAHQARSGWRDFAGARSGHLLAFALGPVALVAALALAWGSDYIPWLLSDISSTANVNPWTGALSTLGALLWLMAATVAVFASRLLTAPGEAHAASFLRWGGAIAAYFCIDDLFLLHEAVEYLFGVSDKVVFVPLGVGIMMFLASFRALILTLNYSLLGLALAFLGISLVFDTPLVFGTSITTLFFEESFKWLGIVCWTAFFATSARHLVARTLQRG